MISRHKRHTRWLLARRTVPVPATRADRREINETRRQLQPLQPMLFQRIIDLSSDPSRSYANRAFTSTGRCVPDGSMQSQNFHRCARCEIMRPSRAATRRQRKKYPLIKIIVRFERITADQTDDKAKTRIITLPTLAGVDRFHHRDGHDRSCRQPNLS